MRKYLTIYFWSFSGSKLRKVAGFQISVMGLKFPFKRYITWLIAYFFRYLIFLYMLFLPLFAFLMTHNSKNRLYPTNFSLEPVRQHTRLPIFVYHRYITRWILQITRIKNQFFTIFWQFLAFLAANNSKNRLYPTGFSSEPVRQLYGLPVFGNRWPTAWWSIEKNWIENQI